MKKILCMAALTVACASSVFAGSGSVIEAVVNNEVITQKDVDDFARFVRLRAGRQLEAVNTELSERDREEIVQVLIRDRLMLQEAKRRGVRVDPNRVKSRIDDMRRQYGSEALFQEALAKQGMVQGDVENRIQEQLMLMAVIDARVRQRIIVKPAEVTEFYQNNGQLFVVPESREFESIAVNSEEQARQLAQDCANGQSLEDAARAAGVVVNKLTAAKDGQLKPDVETAVFNLSVNKVSDPVMSEGVYYIFKVLSMKPSYKRSLADVQQDIAGMLFNKKMGESMDAWEQELRKNAYIKIS